MRRRSKSRKAIAAMIIAGAAAAAGAVLLARKHRNRSAPRSAHESPPRDEAPPQPPADPSPDSQPAADGFGPLRHRRYAVAIVDSSVTATSLMHAIESQLAELSPASLAEFSKSVGSDSSMRTGDEYTITMLGPWNGRVRVAEVTSHSFTLVTCEGHPEAGHIVFAVQDDAQTTGALQISINSYARSRDAAVELAYTTLGQQVQTEVWVTFLQRVAKLAGVTSAPEVRIETEEYVD